MSSDYQKVRNTLGLAQNMPEAVIAMMALTDFVGTLDARLSALEAAEPQAQPVKISYVEHLAAEVKQLRESLYASRLDREALQAEIKRLTDGFYALEAQRNALAAQLDDLRNVNAGLRKSNASQQDLLVSGRLRSLRRIEALLAVEWVTGECPWCGNSHREGHDEDCQRQAALR